MKPHLAITALLLTGCAASPPGTPGAGSGQTYTPVVDMQGVDQARYNADLGECRRYAGTIDSGKAALEGAVGGAIMGAVISAMLGGKHQANMQVGSATGFTGLAAAENRAIGKQERIIINCMAGRGYRTLDAAMVVPSNYSPVPGNVAGQSSPYYTRQQPDPPKGAIAAGQDTIQAEHFAKAQACHETPRASLAAKGAGFETYSITCMNGDTIMVRCEFGNCRTLR